jgi:hypothetical protein
MGSIQVVWYVYMCTILRTCGRAPPPAYVILLLCGFEFKLSKEKVTFFCFPFFCLAVRLLQEEPNCFCLAVRLLQPVPLLEMLKVTRKYVLTTILYVLTTILYVIRP